MIDGIPNRPLYFYQKDIIDGDLSIIFHQWWDWRCWVVDPYPPSFFQFFFSHRKQPRPNQQLVKDVKLPGKHGDITDITCKSMPFWSRNEEKNSPRFLVKCPTFPWKIPKSSLIHPDSRFCCLRNLLGGCQLRAWRQWRLWAAGAAFLRTLGWFRILLESFLFWYVLHEMSLNLFSMIFFLFTADFRDFGAASGFQWVKNQ